MKTYRRILAATDLSPSSMPGFKEALDVTAESRAELLIAFAYQPPNLTQAQAIAPAVYEEWDQNLRIGAEAKFEPLVQQARDRKIKARALILRGSPNGVISEAAKDNDVDLIIMGSHGRTGISRPFQGSVSSHVAATASCPVITVPIA
jgi:nucleotide-binding universal stress UspA family protein